MATTTVEDNTALSKQYETPLGVAHGTMQALKDRIKTHYDLASEYYLNLWYVTTSHVRPVTLSRLCGH
jgi:tocopherol O-methyltransferase